MARLLFRMEDRALRRAERTAILPVVEVFQITICQSARGVRYEIFSAYAEDGGEHPYLSGLRAELDRAHGVYIFYDSRGRALYAGKAPLTRSGGRSGCGPFRSTNWLHISVRMRSRTG